MGFFKKMTALVLTAALMLSASVLSTGVSAASAGADIKGNTVSQALKMDGAAYMNWLLCHEHDNYYLGTPYEPWDRRNPNGDCKGANGYLDEEGVPGMNCMGFVWHVLYKATVFSGGSVDDVELAMSRLGFYRGLNITRRYFANKQAMLKSGYLEKGDIIWMILDQDEDSDSPYHHTGIYWGDGHSDLLWHSNRVTGGQGECNAISKILPEVDRNTMYIVLKVGAKTLDKPRLTSAVNTAKGIQITWGKVAGAVKYRVFKKAAKGWTALGDTTANTFTYTGAAQGEDDIFTVRCITSCGKGYTSMFDSRGIRCQRRSPSSAYAPAIETAGNYEYTLLKDGTAQITGYKGTASVPDIPAKLNGHGVTAIGSVSGSFDSAPFGGCTQFTQVTVPEGITFIGDYSFVGCTGLTRVTLPESLQRIGKGAFGSCTKLKSVIVPPSVESIGYAAFGWNVSAKTAIPAGGFTVYGYTGSEAERYARAEENGSVAFIPVGSLVSDIIGDADGDGGVTISDATVIQLRLADLPTKEYIEKNADVDGDCEVTIVDATVIQRHLAGLVINDRIGKPAG